MSEEYIGEQMLESIHDYAETSRKVDEYDTLVLENAQLKDQVRCLAEAHKAAHAQFVKTMQFIHGAGPGQKGALEAAWLAGNMHAKGVLTKNETHVEVSKRAYKGLIEVSLKLGGQQ